MRKNSHLSIRIPEDERIVLNEISNLCGITVTELIRGYYVEAIIKSKYEGNNKFIEKFIVKNKGRIQRDEIYQVSNCISSIMNFAAQGKFVTGDINMKVINSQIDSFMARYDCMSKEIQDMLKKEKKALEMFRDETYLKNKFKNWRFVQYEQKKRLK